MTQPAKIETTVTDEGFNGEGFKNFVVDYYASLELEETSCDLETIYFYIFGDKSHYASFLLHCRELDYSFIQNGSNENIKKTFFLLAFEQVRLFIQDGVSFNVGEILGGVDNQILLRYAHANIPKNSTTFMSGLLRSIDFGIPTNERGEVLYYVGSEDGLYKVYSFESGIHHVNERGEVVNFELKNKGEREELSFEIQSFQEILDISYQSDYSNEEALRLLEWRNEYLSDTGRRWLGTSEDMVMFRLWLREQIREYTLIRDGLISVANKKGPLKLAGGTDMGDFNGERAYPGDVHHQTGLIRGV